MNRIISIKSVIIGAVICLLIPAGAVFAHAKTTTSLNKCKIETEYSKTVYTDKDKTPKVVITYKGKKLKEDRDYSVTYRKNHNPGKATAMIMGKGDYSSMDETHFEIVTGKVSDVKAEYEGTYPPGEGSKINVSWKESKCCDYYIVDVKRGKKEIGTYTTEKTKFTVKNVTETGKYNIEVTAVAGPKEVKSKTENVAKEVSDKPGATVAKIDSPGFQRLDVSWKEVPGATGYIVTEKCGSSETTKKIDKVETTEASFQHSSGTTCSYYVQAYSLTKDKKTVKGDPSNVVSGTTRLANIGQATDDERGHVRGGKAGDQNGKEVSITHWSYSSNGGSYKHWRYVARFKDEKKAEIAASTMEAACANDYIGYDQSSRTSLYYTAKPLNWDVSKIRTPCECSCSPLVSVCINSSGISVPANWHTGNSSMLKYLTNSGQFEILTDSKYLTTDVNLKRGDILVSPGHHTAMVL